MIKMQVRIIHQASCPTCKKAVQVNKKDAEVWCHCDEKVTYSKEYNEVASVLPNPFS